MIEQADGALRAWLGKAAGGAEVWLDPPRPGEQRRGLSLYLFELSEAPPARGAPPSPLQLQLRYLVTAWAESPEDEHRLLEDVAFAALRRSGVEAEVELGAVDLAVWRGFGVPPRASLVLRVPLRREQPAPRAPLVREVETRFVPSRRLDGVVLGPGDVPVAGADVRLPAMGLAATTGGDGRFTFARVPEEPSAKRFQVSARGAVWDVESPPPQGGGPFILRIEIEET